MYVYQPTTPFHACRQYCPCIHSPLRFGRLRALMTHVPASTLEKPQLSKDTPELPETVTTGSAAPRVQTGNGMEANMGIGASKSGVGVP